MYNHILKHILPITCLLFLIGVTSTAAQQVQTLDTLVVSKELVISSSRVPQTAASSGRSITIVPAQVIEDMPAHTIDEVLRYVSGVEVQTRGAFGAQSDFSIRGSTFSQVLVMVDGMRINDPLTAHFNANIPVAPSEIKRIEVLHGPAAAQYGADAVGGVINIITHTFGRTYEEAGTEAFLKAGYGQDELKIGKGNFTLYTDRYRLNAGGMWHQSPGQQLAQDYANYFNIGNGSLSGGAQLNENWDLALRTGYDYRDFNAKYFYTASPYDDATEQVTSWWNQARLQHVSSNSVTTVNGAFKRSTDRFAFNAQTPANVHTTYLGSLQLNQYRSLSDRWNMSYGLVFNNRRIRSNDRGNHSDLHYGTFTTVRWQPAVPLSLAGSLRLDHDESYGTELMPQLNISYQKENWIWRASGGRSVRAPSYTERYVSTNLEGPLTEGRNLGNPDLQAEQAWTADTGIDLFPTSFARLSATVFLRETSQMVDYLMTHSSQISNDDNLMNDAHYSYAQNLNSVQARGLETEVYLSHHPGGNWVLNSTLGYTLVDFSGNEDVTSKYMANYARHLVNAVVTVSRGSLRGTVNTVWKSRQENRMESTEAFKTSSYNIWNLKLSYRISEHADLGLQIDNLFDIDYQDKLGAFMPGRWALGTLTWNL